MKRFLSLFLSLVMLLSVTAGLDLSAYANTSGDYEYSILENGTANVCRYLGSGGDVSIPSELDGYIVTKIEGFAFNSCESLTSIVIPSTILEIGWNAFGGCINLTYVTISDGVEYISGAAFNNCSLKTITIPRSVTNIGSWAFAACTSLVSINVDENNEVYSSINGVLFDKAKENLIMYPNGNEKSSYIIPDGVIGINSEAFNGCDRLTNVTFPDSVKSIGNYAFEECHSLADVYYLGTKENWNKIDIDEYNECLTNATIHCSDGVINQKEELIVPVEPEKPTETEKPTQPTQPERSTVPIQPANPQPITQPTTQPSSPVSPYTAKASKTKSAKISKLTKGKKQFKASWKKVSGVTGYQIQYSTSKKFTKKTTKSITVKGSKKTSATVKKLKSKKKYYVRIRTYKNENGKKIYSPWSKAKTVTIK